MEEKTGKAREKEINYIRIQQQRDEFVGQDCLTVVVGNTVHAIGYQQEYSTCLDFIVEQLADDPKAVVEKGHFTDLVDLYKYLFENCGDEYELKNFLIDFYDGVDENEEK